MSSVRPPLTGRVRRRRRRRGVPLLAVLAGCAALALGAVPAHAVTSTTAGSASAPLPGLPPGIVRMQLNPQQFAILGTTPAGALVPLQASSAAIALPPQSLLSGWTPYPPSTGGGGR